MKQIFSGRQILFLACFISLSTTDIKAVNEKSFPDLKTISEKTNKQDKTTLKLDKEKKPKKDQATPAINVMIGGFYYDYPEWWVSRNIIDTNATEVNDYAAVNSGQMKWIVSNAYEELNANLPGGSGTNIESLINNLNPENNFCAINGGQLKYLGMQIYDRLITEGYTNQYPWTATTTDDVDYAAVNIGQVKNVFNFDLTVDAGENGLADWWEMHWFGNTNQTASGDYDSDGLNNLNEYLYGGCPTNSDTDADGINDVTEVNNRTDPNNSDTNVPVIVITFPVNYLEYRQIP